MTASERLAALDAAAANGPFIMDDPAERGLAMLRNALPEIVAVVEAAEVYAPIIWKRDENDGVGPELRRRLAALEEKLKP